MAMVSMAVAPANPTCDDTSSGSHYHPRVDEAGGLKEPKEKKKSKQGKSRRDGVTRQGSDRSLDSRKSETKSKQGKSRRDGITRSESDRSLDSKRSEVSKSSRRSKSSASKKKSKDDASLRSRSSAPPLTSNHLKKKVKPELFDEIKEQRKLQKTLRVRDESIATETGKSPGKPEPQPDPPNWKTIHARVPGETNDPPNWKPIGTTKSLMSKSMEAYLKEKEKEEKEAAERGDPPNWKPTAMKPKQVVSKSMLAYQKEKEKEAQELELKKTNTQNLEDPENKQSLPSNAINSTKGEKVQKGNKLQKKSEKKSQHGDHHQNRHHGKARKSHEDASSSSPPRTRGAEQHHEKHSTDTDTDIAKKNKKKEDGNENDHGRQRTSKREKNRTRSPSPNKKKARSPSPDKKKGKSPKAGKNGTVAKANLTEIPVIYSENNNDDAEQQQELNPPSQRNQAKVEDDKEVSSSVHNSDTPSKQPLDDSINHELKPPSTRDLHPPSERNLTAHDSEEELEESASLSSLDNQNEKPYLQLDIASLEVMKSPGLPVSGNGKEDEAETPQTGTKRGLQRNLSNRFLGQKESAAVDEMKKSNEAPARGFLSRSTSKRGRGLFRNANGGSERSLNSLNDDGENECSNNHSALPDTLDIRLVHSCVPNEDANDDPELWGGTSLDLDHAKEWLRGAIVCERDSHESASSMQESSLAVIHSGAPTHDNLDGHEEPNTDINTNILQPPSGEFLPDVGEGEDPKNKKTRQTFWKKIKRSGKREKTKQEGTTEFGADKDTGQLEGTKPTHGS